MVETPEPPAHEVPIQFDKAELAGAVSGTCRTCKTPIGGTYYEANGHVICERCWAQIQTGEAEGSGMGRFLRAAFFGSLAAALGSAIYYGVAALTNMEFGLIAIVVGLMVGAAVRHGSGARGGWLYQGLAMFLTYASIVSTYIPPIVKSIREQSQQPKIADAGAQATPAAIGATPAPAATASPAVAVQPEPQVPSNPLAALLFALLFLLAIAFAAPFLAGFENIMGIVIIGIGLFEAWKINRRVPLVITGPYRVGAPAPPPSA